MDREQASKKEKQYNATIQILQKQAEENVRVGKSLEETNETMEQTAQQSNIEDITA